LTSDTAIGAPSCLTEMFRAQHVLVLTHQEGHWFDKQILSTMVNLQQSLLINIKVY